MIYIGDWNMVQNLMAHNQHHDRVIQTALLAAPPPVEGADESSPMLEHEPPAMILPPLSEVAAAMRDGAVAAAASGRFSECVEKNAAVLAELGEAGGSSWHAASAHLAKATCHRRGREFDLAARHVEHALVLFPRFTAAMLQVRHTLRTPHPILPPRAETHSIRGAVPRLAVKMRLAARSSAA